MKKNDFVLPILIILLMFFVPCTIYGLKMHKIASSAETNPNHLPKVDDTLYFYSKNDTLIGTYKCLYGLCNSAKTSIDDSYNVHYEGEDVAPGVFGTNNVFIQDGDFISLYNLESAQTISKYMLIKNYGVGINDNQIIVQNEDGFYGLFDMEDFRLIIPTTYSYMGLRGTLNESGQIDSSILIVNKDHSYYLINLEEEMISPKLNNPIYDYTDKIIYTISETGNYFILNYDGDLVVDDIIKAIGIYDEVTVFINSSGELKIYNSDFTNLLKEEKYDTTNVSFSYESGVLTVTDEDKGNFIEYELSGAPSPNPEEDNKSNSDDDFWNND